MADYKKNSSTNKSTINIDPSRYKKTKPSASNDNKIGGIVKDNKTSKLLANSDQSSPKSPKYKAIEKSSFDKEHIDLAKPKNLDFIKK